MITRNNRLYVFENFYVDRSLPKYNVKKEAVTEEDKTLMMVDGNMPMPPMPMSRANTNNFDEVDTWIRDYLQYARQQSPSLRNRLRYFMATRFFFRKHAKPLEIKVSKTDYSNIDVFFKAMHGEMKSLELTSADVQCYEEMITHAKALGQTAMYEKLTSQMNILLVEISMVKDHTVKYVTEKEVLEYYKKSRYSDFLNMSFIRNYMRVIPSDVVELKKKCDERGWFDNYAVLYFDRLGDSAEMTNAEKEKAKDPILFGMIEGSDKLYFVADWVDEYCDLTLEKMMKVLGKKTSTINNKSLNKHIREIAR